MPSARVLIVDDDEDVRTLYSAVLEAAGYVPVTASNGREALAVARATLPSVILLDLMMPVMDGEAFRRAQLADDRLAPIPTICFSARWNAQKIAQDLSMDDCLVKPVQVDDVLAAVERVVRRGH
jgi:CheY-like chemotaxis protein